MFCPYCGKQIDDDSKHCQYCGKDVTGQPSSESAPAPETAPETAPAPAPETEPATAPAASGAWYKKWWIWVIAGGAVAVIVTVCILLSFIMKPKTVEPTPIATIATTATTPEATTAAATSLAPKKQTIDDIIASGYEKVGYVALYNNIDKYKGKNIITAAEVKDIGESALYFTLDENKKTLAFYEFRFTDKDEIKDIRKGEYAVIYGTVNEKGMLGSHIEIENSHVAAVKDEAKKFFDGIKDEKAKIPTTAPSTTKAATTAAKKETTAPATTEAPTKSPEKPTEKPTEKPEPATTKPDDTQPTTKGEENVLFNEKNIKVTYEGYEILDDYVVFKIHVDNKSKRDFYVGAMDSKANGKPIDLLAMEYVEKGKSADTGMYIIRYDLEEQGIQRVDKLNFKFVFDFPDDWDHPLISKDIEILTLDY